MEKGKGAQAQIITVILLILLVLALIVIVWNVVFGFIGGSEDDVGDAMTCLTGVELDVLGSCYELLGGPNWKVYITLKNKGKIKYTNNFKLHMIYEDGTDDEVILENSEGLDILEEKQLEKVVFEAPNIDKLLIIPHAEIKGETINCYEQAVEFDRLEECDS